MTNPKDGTPARCEVCTAPVAFEGRYYGRRTRVCAECRGTFDCAKCGEVPSLGGKCECAGGVPTLPKWEPIQ